MTWHLKKYYLILLLSYYYLILFSPILVICKHAEKTKDLTDKNQRFNHG